MSFLTNSPTLSAVGVTPNTHDANALFGGVHLIHTHQDTSEYLLFQSHVQTPLIMNPPKDTAPMTDEEKKELIFKLRKEKRMIKMLKDVIDMVELTNTSLLEQMEGDRSGWNTGW
ncbi:hypothetical protein AGABI2DRAFT_122502 [Agaricus bisporus var. bisporus H97]|uniref:hypothetical protein n=1 Tax=Agaricus bisporus var. bisporus (strain H97 / ATCC MYA-4626 / FGSC 10389) TaxID=936046 RepID=UPI00029F7125|nr:hypothetical protein AGABI2DRAFT_122502 [Agaricus bisporus var. bisporus H97]EKV42934.1 hypothetical protein AGABI2DRAFT_122502 [Agaricus bisporus var. bisporus H97]